jgi:glycosyltransferase involved in cell wall biosynthesis
VPRVDVLLPVRDAAETLPEAIADLRAQTLKDFTCWILDDGSRDDSRSLAEAAAAEDPRFRSAPGPACGIVAALNRGIAHVTAPWVARFDADDRCEPERLRLQVERLEREAWDVAACGVRFFGDVSANLRAYEGWMNSRRTHEEIVRDLFVESPLAHPSVVLRTDSLRDVGGYRDGPWPEDYDLWLRGWRAGWRFGKVDDVLVALRQHDDRLTWNDTRYSSRAFLECKTGHWVEARGLAGGEIIVWGAGRDGKRAVKAFRKRGVQVRHFVDIAPTKIGRRMIGLDVLPVEALRERPGCPVVAAVGVKGARQEIRRTLVGWGYSEGPDFVCFG